MSRNGAGVTPVLPIIQPLAGDRLGPAGGLRIGDTSRRLAPSRYSKSNYQFGFCFRFGFKSRSFCGIGHK